MTPLAQEAQALVDRLAALVPDLAAQAPDGERQRQIPDAAWRAIEETGVFRLMVPKARGGLELDLDAFLEVGLTLAAADISTAWVTSFLVEHNWMFCQFPESFQQALYAERSFVNAPGAIAPTGQARQEDGGFRLSGRWAWGTGVMHSSWVLVGGLVEGMGPEGIRFFALPKSEVKVEDTWDIAGMCATGSHDMVISDVLVPEERSVSILDMTLGQAPGSRLYDGPLYRTPMIPILLMAASMPLIGHAREVVRRFREKLTGHTRMLSPQKQSEKASSQMRLARVTAEVRQAELLLRDVVSDVMRLRNDAKPEDRARWSASIAHAVHQSKQVIQDVAQGSGASAQFHKDPLQRALRDVNVASCHIAFDLDAQRELHGRIMLGLDPGAGLY